MKEVNNSIAEFDKHKQEYDEERVKQQVRVLWFIILIAICCHFC